MPSVARYGYVAVACGALAVLCPLVSAAALASAISLATSSDPSASSWMSAATGIAFLGGFAAVTSWVVGLVATVIGLRGGAGAPGRRVVAAGAVVLGVAFVLWLVMAGLAVAGLFEIGNGFRM